MEFVWSAQSMKCLTGGSFCCWWLASGDDGFATAGVDPELWIAGSLW
jgi:hypothetical protein